MKKRRNILCRLFGHKWPSATNILMVMADIENRNQFPTKTDIQCRRCREIRELNKKAKQIRSVAVPVNMLDYRGMYEYLVWHASKHGLPSNAISYIEALYLAAKKNS